MMDLLDTIRRLCASEINCGLETRWDAGLLVWIGDGVNGRRAQAEFQLEHLDDAARWLDSQARRLFPSSDYTRAREAN
jgi:hypothetical protein